MKELIRAHQEPQSDNPNGLLPHEALVFEHLKANVSLDSATWCNEQSPTTPDVDGSWVCSRPKGHTGHLHMAVAPWHGRDVRFCACWEYGPALTQGDIDEAIRSIMGGIK